MGLARPLRRLFHRRDEVPAEVREQLPPDQRVVSWADVSGGSVVVATPAGLWWPTPEGQRLIDWYRVSKAVWQSGTLTVIEADVVDDLLVVDRAPVRVELEVPRDLPPVVRKRVDANVVRSEVIAFDGGAARFVARRVPGRDGVCWWARLEAGTDDDEEVRAAVANRLALLRAQHDATRRDL